MLIDDEELRVLYDLSSQERLQRLETGLANLQKQPDDEAILEELRRDAHSLKGDSRAVGVDTIEDLIRQIEELLKQIQAKQLVFTSHVSDCLYQGIRAIRALVQEAVTDHSHDLNINIEQVLQQLLEVTTTEDQWVSADPISVANQVPDRGSINRSTAFIEDDELRNLYDLSSRERCQKLKDNLRHLQKSPTNFEMLRDLRQDVHDLKEDSRQVGAEDIELLLHQVDEILAIIESKRAGMASAVGDRLQPSLEAIEKLIHEAVTGEASDIDVTQVLNHLVTTAGQMDQLLLDIPSESLPEYRWLDPPTSTNTTADLDSRLDHSQLDPIDPIGFPESISTESLSPDPSSTASFVSDKGLRDLYSVSSRECLQALTAGILVLKDHPDEFDHAETVSNLRQAAHDLMEDSQSIGLDTVAALGSQIEEILETVQSDPRVLTARLSHEFDRRLDAMRQLVHEAVTGQPSSIDMDQVLELLIEEPLELAQAQSEPDPLPVAVPTTHPVESEPPQVAASFIDDEDLREVYKTSSQERLQRMESGLLHLEKHPTDHATLDQLLREAHSLKGDSRAVGIDTVEALTHEIEEILERCKRQQLVLTSDVGDRLYQGLDTIGKLVREAVTGQPGRVDITLVLNNLRELSTSPTTPQELLSVSTAFSPPSTTDTGQPSSQDSGQDSAFSPQAIDEPYHIETIRVQTRDLDILMTQTEELTVAKNSMAQVVTEIEEMAILWKEWKASQSKGLTLATSTVKANSYPEKLEKLLESLTTSTKENSGRIDQISAELRERITTLRLLPLANIFQLFPRLVRDLAKQQAKQVELIIEGGETTADKSILEDLKDSLMHMIRNSIDHGIEISDERERLGKPPIATIWLRAYPSNNSVVIEIEDDGRGLDLDKIRQTAIKRGLYYAEELAAMTTSQIQNLIFVPGFSTRSFITEISGRGIGLDVVRTNIERLKGDIQIESTPGQGCLFRIQLSTRLTNINVVLLEVQGIIHALPIEFMETTVLVSPDQVSMVNDRPTIEIGGQTTPVVDLGELLELSNSRAYSPTPKTSQTNLQQYIVVKVGEERAGFLVDRLLDMQEVVIKPQSRILKRVRNVAGATILPTGEVCTLLNASDLIRSVQQQTIPIASIRSRETTRRQPVILLVEDSVTVRTQERRLLERAGYEVVIAFDGLDGYNKLQTRTFDAVLSDVEMPNLDGLSMTAKIRQHKEYQNLPIILVTTLDSDEDKQRGADAGANAYIIKSMFNQDVLLEILGRLVA